MRTVRRTLTSTVAALAGVLLGALALIAALPLASEASPSLEQLNSALSRNQQQAEGLAASVSGLSGMISSLDAQVAFVRQREALMRAELAHDRLELAQTTASLIHERHVLQILVARLHTARVILARQLVSSYEGGTPDLMTVILDSHGFTDLLDRIQYLRSAEGEQNQTIQLTRTAKASADRAARRLAALEAAERRMTAAATTRVRALAGMNSLLRSKEVALRDARAAQSAELVSVQAREQALRGEIAQVEAQQAAARAAAEQAAARQAAAAAPTLAGAPVPYGSSSAGGGWAIPSAVVACESGGQNLTPNSAGASGYYQIIPSTWKLYGGTGPAAYLASAAEQAAVAARIWAGGAGAGNWVCAQMLGIH